MNPSQNRTSAANDVEKSEVAIAELVARQMPLKPGETKVAVADLLHDLRRQRLHRASLGLDLWMEDLPSPTPKRRRGTVRRSRLEAFIRKNHAKAVSFANTILQDQAAAEEAVSKTYLEVACRRTRLTNFFRALKNNVRDLLRQRGRDFERFESLEATRDLRQLQADDGGSDDSGQDFSWEPASSRLEDQDPLDQLILREEQKETADLVQAAMSDPRWRYLKLRKWARPLVEDVRKRASRAHS